MKPEYTESVTSKLGVIKMQTGGLGSETAGFKVTVMTWTIAYLTSWQQLLRRDVLKLIQMIKTLFLFSFSIQY